MPNTGQFHRNDPMGADFLYDREYSYTPISADTAADKVRGQLGRIDERSTKWLADRYRADPGDRRRAMQQVVERPAIKSSPPQRSRRFTADVSNSEPGVWMTYRSYPSGKAATASDIRHGKVKAFAGRTVAAKVVRYGDQWVVQVSRLSHKTKPTKGRSTRQLAAGPTQETRTEEKAKSRRK